MIVALPGLFSYLFVIVALPGLFSYLFVLIWSNRYLWLCPPSYLNAKACDINPLVIIHFDKNMSNMSVILFIYLFFFYFIFFIFFFFFFFFFF